MQTDPLITTVIPTYRRPDMLRRAIRSVLDQTYPNFKICVYDNASNDETPEVVRTLALQDSRIHYHCHAANIGTQDNFIFGLSQADTPLVHLISDDDFLLPECFAQATSALKRNPRAAFFSGGLLSANPDGHVKALVRYGSEVAQTYCPPELFCILMPYTRTWTSALFRRASLECLGGLKKETGYSFSIDLILRSAIRFEAVLSDLPCAVFTVHPDSSSVAEASEAFESMLTLALFDSLNRAIDCSLKDNIIKERDAAEMKKALRRCTERNCFRGAFSVTARGHLPIALHASEVLAEVFKRKDLAVVIRTVALENVLGAILRLAVRSARVARGLRFAMKTRFRYPAYSEMVKRRILQLNV